MRSPGAITVLATMPAVAPQSRLSYTSRFLEFVKYLAYFSIHVFVSDMIVSSSLAMGSTLFYRCHEAVDAWFPSLPTNVTPPAFPQHIIVWSVAHKQPFLRRNWNCFVLCVDCTIEVYNIQIDVIQTKRQHKPAQDASFDRFHSSLSFLTAIQLQLQSTMSVPVEKKINMSLGTQSTAAEIILKLTLTSINANLLQRRYHRRQQDQEARCCPQEESRCQACTYHC